MERRANIKAKGKATTAAVEEASRRSRIRKTNSGFYPGMDAGEDDEVSSETKSDARSSRCDRDDWEGEDEAFSEEGVRRKMGVLARMVGMEGCGQPAAVLTEVVRVLKELDGRARGVCSSGLPDLGRSPATYVMVGDVGKMIGVGLVWGTTNSLMRRGALLWDQKLRSARSAPAGRLDILSHARRWLDLLLVWQYSVPFIVNLLASAAFFCILGDSPISVAVPVTNATTFAATAVTALLLGEEMRIGLVLLGTFLILVGVWICIS